MPAVERSRPSDFPTIPRPPNSWILYRSDMVALLAPPPPGTTRSQADVSRIISAMWKTEKPEVKAEYERRAEVKKLEHAAMYPNYRYMPKSKELKEELRKAKEERRKKKNKRDSGQDASGSSRPRDIPYTSHGHPFLLPPDSSQYIQGGPSPPMSAAGSPSPEPAQAPQHIVSLDERVYKPDAHSQGENSYYRQHSATSQPVHEHSAPQHLIHSAPLQPPTTSHYRTPTTSLSVQQNELYFSPHFTQLPVSPPEENDQQYVRLHNDSVVPTQNDDYLSFDLQQFAADSLENWALQNPEFQTTIDHFLNNTSGDCYQLQLDALVEGNLDQTPVGPLEVEVGQIDFDSSHCSWQVGVFQPLSNAAPPENTAGPPLQTSTSEGSNLPSTDLNQSFQMDQYINFNPIFNFTGNSPAVEETPVTSTRTSYVPPAGAAHAGKRRVAGSWNNSFAIQDPIDV
ncbi:hypothetical protein C0993_006666 [Termitomyces sp. T159_Od127]|nr:hypothetical protein C0993_006666 [Termitomyces sp. T159_Od127]